MNYDSKTDFGDPLRMDWTWKLIAMILCLGVGWLLGSALNGIWATLADTDSQALIRSFGKDSPLKDRNLMRLFNLTAHFCTFTLSGILIGVVVFRRGWSREFGLSAGIKPVALLSAALLGLTIFPLAQAVYWLNQQIPLPEALVRQESKTDAMVAGMMLMDSGWELAFNLLIAALVPAVGEELIFRGLVQNQLEKQTGRTHLAVWITAVVFSAIHFQFAGFFARMLLGGVLGYTLVWTRSLWAPIALHFVFNGWQVAGACRAGEHPEIAKPDTPAAPSIPLVIISVLFTFALIRGLYREREG